MSPATGGSGSEKETAAVRDLYFHGANLFAPGGETFCGHGDIDRFYLGYLASFPDAVFSVASATINRDHGKPIRVALRWSLRGDPLRVRPFRTANRRAGLCHGLEPRIYRRWTHFASSGCVIDEVSIWKQIIAHGMAA